jgi:hypothetical protein
MVNDWFVQSGKVDITICGGRRLELEKFTDGLIVSICRHSTTRANEK